MKTFILVFGVVFSFYLLSPGVSDAAIYKYVDKDGVPCFADDLQVVPEQYRASAVIVEGDAKDDETKASRPVTLQNTETQSLAAAVETKPVRRPLPLSIRVMISAAVAIAGLVIFLVLKKLPELKDNKKVLLAIRGSLIGVVAIYLVVAHVKDVLIVFGLASQTIEDAQQRSAEKGKKAAQVIKSIDAMFDEAQKAQKTMDTEEAAAGQEKK